MSKKTPELKIVSAKADQQRIAVNKTYKLFINGQFPRTESGRYYPVKDSTGNLIANVCLGSRKDFRDAVTAARKALSSWSGRTAYNRAQIVYRLAEMLESRKAQFIEELKLQGISADEAVSEVDNSIDRLVYYAGWADKYTQIYGTVNPVSTSHFNFSIPEPVGVVAIIAPENSGLLGFVSALVPAIVGGNTVVILASESLPLSAITFGEAMATSDLPAGVINILTGSADELYTHFASHKDVNSIIFCDESPERLTEIQKLSTNNFKRFIKRSPTFYKDQNAESPELIMDTQEIKTTWHPIGK